MKDTKTLVVNDTRYNNDRFLLQRHAKQFSFMLSSWNGKGFEYYSYEYQGLTLKVQNYHAISDY